MCEQRKHGSVGAGAGNRPGYPTAAAVRRADGGGGREGVLEFVLDGRDVAQLAV
ncbi:MAG: hypothetical protein M3356_04050 [Actinomycetota bacterium]|nr:hypothetical protein [Actinomycetota bacterium]